MLPPFHFEFPVKPPYDWTYLYDLLYCHRLEGIESFVDRRYRRSIRIEDCEGALEVRFDQKRSCIHVDVHADSGIDVEVIKDRVRHVFDTKMDPEQHREHVTATDAVSELYRDLIGIRIHGAWDGFEGAVCIILGQLVSVAQGRQLAKRVIELYGDEVKTPVFHECRLHFPTATRLKDADLSGIGLAKLRQSAVRDLAALVADGEINLSPDADLIKTRKALLSIRGVGKWTTEMIAMRCLGDRNAFPSTDLVAKRALIENNLLKGDWSPWNAYITLALWKRYAKVFTQPSAPSKLNTDLPSGR